MKKKRDPDWLAALASRIFLSREALGIKPVDLAKELGISPARWSHYETGKRPLDIEIAVKFCTRYGLTLDWLYRGMPQGLPHDIANRILSADRSPNTFPN